MTDTITIDFDTKCAECGKAGATPSGLCLDCHLKVIKYRPMQSRIGRLVQERWHKIIKDKAGLR